MAAIAGSALLAVSDLGRLCALLAVGPYFAAALIWLAGARIFDIRNLIGVAPFAAVAVASLIAALPPRAALGETVERRLRPVRVAAS